MGEFAKYAKSLGLSDDLVSKLLVGSGAANAGQPGTTAADQLRGSIVSMNQAKGGKQVKAPVVPFYIGTTDGRRK